MQAAPAPGTPASTAPAPGAPASAPAPLTPDEEAEAQTLVANDCLSCHTAQMLEQQRITRKQWEAEVKKMQGWGAPVEADEVDLLARALAHRYGPKAAPYAAPPLAQRTAVEAVAPLPDGALGKGSAAAGRPLYEAACAICHGADAHGAAIGVNLADRPVLYRAPEFAAVVREGRNRMPQFVLDDGQVAAILAFLRSQP